MYADLLFFADFLLDCIVLCGTKWLISAPTRLGNMLLAAGIGALVSTVYTIVLGNRQVNVFLHIILGAAVSAVMVWIAFSPKSKKAWILAVLVTYANAFLLAGIVQWISVQGIGGQRVVILVMGAGICLAGTQLCIRLQERERQYCTISLLMNGETIRLRGLVDSGNLLRIPENGKRVCVVQASLIQPYFNKEENEAYHTGNLRKIAYRSVGCQQGHLSAIQISCMRVESIYGECLWEQQWIALMPHEMHGEAQAIIHPDMMKKL